jgi:hypothetical protein
LAQSRPSITGTAHTLPFDKLSPRDFERLCLWLVQREGFDRAEHLGLAGSEQGRDVVAYKPTPHGEELWYFQCKRYGSIHAGTLKREVDKYLELAQEKGHLRPAGVVFVVSCAASANVREEVGDYCQEHGLAHEFWALTELDMRVKRHPEVVEEFFQVAERNIIQRILGTGSDERRALRNRYAMLELVRNFWVRGVLEQSLHNAAMIELDMEEKPGAVEHSWDMVLQTGREDRLLSPGTKIMDVFDKMGGSLLILGEPGSGKTTILLELARDTIARAEQDITQPIPVVFNLSSWADKRQPIAKWLVEELNIRYNIPRKFARPWVESDELLLLLDGLDEVALRCREDCVKAINEFRREHLVALVVCSRVADYEALTARLRLQGAVLLQPLTPQQIAEYLGGAGAALSAVRDALQDDPTLQQLAEIPLMLSIMTLAYKDVSVEDLQPVDTSEACRQHLFDTYVQRMFERRGADHPYPPRQTIHWLAWLAQEMSEHAQSVFLIEGLQPDWLAARVQRQVRTVARLVIGLVVGLVFGLGFGLVLGLDFGLAVGLGVGLVVGLLLGLRAIEPVEVLGWSWREAMTGMGVGLVVGLLIGMGVGLVGGLGVGLVTALRLGLGGMKPVEVFEWSSREAAIGVVVCSAVGPVGALGFLFLGGLYFGLSGAEIEAKMVPNQGIRQSAKNALIVGLVGGLVGGLVVVLVGGLGYERRFGLRFGLGVGLIGGLASGLKFGGEAVIKHLILRCFLWRNGHLPWNLVRFLDYTAGRVFLRKVGGGYIFVHRLLQDYFASLYQDQ